MPYALTPFANIPLDEHLLDLLIAEHEADYRRWPSSAEVFLPDGRPPKVGELFVQHDLARTLQFLADEVRGVAVHAAARVLSLAGAGEVVVSGPTRDLAEGSGLTFEDAGRHALKGLSGERQVYRVAG